jgi:signal transduction histidine kinase
VVLWLTRSSSGFRQADLWANALAFSLVWIVGEGVRSRRERLADALERAERLERERDADARQAVSGERLRIAQELHDVVAHAMSVIAVQSGMGAHVIDTQPDEAKKALQAIESTSRSALDELRRMLGVLREEGDHGGALAPAPRADDVHSLIETIRAAGVPVELHWDGMTADVMPPDSVLLNRYRILQEALTNVLKHAGAASVTVTIVERVGETTIEVIDDGRGLAAAAAKVPGSPPGHGLAGMRERVALFGGVLEAGGRVGGGFRVFARLRWTDAADRRPRPLMEHR